MATYHWLHSFDSLHKVKGAVLQGEVLIFVSEQWLPVTGNL